MMKRSLCWQGFPGDRATSNADRVSPHVPADFEIFTARGFRTEMAVIFNINYRIFAPP